MKITAGIFPANCSLCEGKDDAHGAALIETSGDNFRAHRPDTNMVLFCRMPKHFLKTGTDIYGSSIMRAALRAICTAKLVPRSQG